MKSSKFLLPAAAVGMGALAALSGHLSACSSVSSKAMAFQAKSRDQLIGGPRALGDVGDLVLANGKVRAVIQAAGASRGFGVFGGSLIDLDLERPRPAAGGQPQGADGISEIFPAFFLRGLEPDSVSIKADGSDGGPAIVSVKGKGSEFITEVKLINDLFVGDKFQYEIEYILEPYDPNDPDSEFKSRSLLMRVTATNASDKPLSLPTQTFPVAFGLVTLFGDGQKLFLPGSAGYDLRFSLEDSYKTAPPLPNLPGVISRALASSGDKVSYALAPEPSPRNWVYTHRAAYPGATRDSLIIPFVAASFTGAFFHDPPSELEAGKATTYSSRLFVGTGDIASALDLAMQAHHDELGTFQATVREEGTGVPLEGVTVSILDSKHNVITSARSQKNGEVKAMVPPGRYTAASVAPNRPSRLTDPEQPIEIEASVTKHYELTVGAKSWLSVAVADKSGRPLPAKVTVIGKYGAEHAKEHPRHFLYDLKINEPLLYSDRADIWAENYSNSQEFIERVLLSDAKGLAEGDLRPGTYKVVASRGPEYTVAEREVTLSPGGSTTLGLVLDRVVDTSTFVAGDFHVHTSHSIDSGISLDERAMTYAAEGIEYLAVTDHNFVTELTPAIARNVLSDFVRACVGLELTTLELGHFNGFPLNYQPGAITRGSFDWFRHPSGELFDRLRQIGALGPERTVVEVNHPRDTIMGYFNAFKLDKDGKPNERTDIARPQGPEFALSSWSESFDALEIFNGKRLELMRTYRVPKQLPPPPLPTNIAQLKAGEVLTDKNGYPAFPGNFEDWLNLLKRGKVITGMGNSDSHHVLDGEAGYARSLVQIGKKPAVASQITNDEVADAIHAQKVVITNGPVAELTVNGSPIGSLVSTTDGALTIGVKVQAAPWMDIAGVNLLVMDGATLPWAPLDDPHAMRVIPVELKSGEVVRAETTVKLALQSDSLIFLEAYGNKSMWPVVPPNEISALMINDAVKVIGGSFGMGDDGYGNLRPSQVHPVTPYALTNPVWVDADGDGQCMGKGRNRSALEQQPRIPVPAQTGYRYIDLFRLLRQFDH